MGEMADYILEGYEREALSDDFCAQRSFVPDSAFYHRKVEGVIVLHRTEKAILLSRNGREYWFPKKHVRESYGKADDVPKQVSIWKDSDNYPKLLRSI